MSKPVEPDSIIQNKPSPLPVKKKPGRPKGGMSKERKDELATLRKFKERVRKRANRLINAQASLAEGLQYLIRIDTVEDDRGRTRKEHVRVTDPEEIVRALDEGLTDGENYYYITAKDPDNKAIDSLLDRGLGKATQAVEIHHTVSISDVLDELDD